jgi:hypothetical protein
MKKMEEDKKNKEVGEEKSVRNRRQEVGKDWKKKKKNTAVVMTTFRLYSLLQYNGEY